MGLKVCGTAVFIQLFVVYFLNKTHIGLISQLVASADSSGAAVIQGCAVTPDSVQNSLLLRRSCWLSTLAL